MTPSQTEIREVLILEPEPLSGAVIAQMAGKVFGGAHIQRTGEPSKAAVALAERSIDVFVVALRGFDLDVITLLGVWAEHDANRTRVLVVTPEVNSSALLAVRTLPIAGVYDSSSCDLGELETAFRVVGNGATYWSTTVQKRIAAIAKTKVTPIRTSDLTEMEGPAVASHAFRLAPPRRRSRADRLRYGKN